MILVTGSGGMLGSHLCARYSRDTIGFTHRELDINNEDSVLTILSRIRPEVVVNCAGITRPDNIDPYQVYLVNTVGPRNLAYWCDQLKIKLIQISTNCVFSGRPSGLYTEYEEPDAKDLYGRTKAQGEVEDWEYKNSLTIRTSFVGWPDPTGRSLLSWLWKQPKKRPLYGYTNALWNGLTVTALADYIVELAYSQLTGVVHLSGQTISKYMLLKTVDELYGWNHNIVPVTEPLENKTLRTARNIPYIAGTDNFEESLRNMRNQGMRDYENAHYNSRASWPTAGV
jgi:dTDP-4-dehydrorhamnose reductase